MHAPESQGKKILDDALKPYAHQLHDAEIERELRDRRPKRKREADVESPAVQAATLALREAEEEIPQASSESAATSNFGGPMRPRSRHSRRSHGQDRGTRERDPLRASDGNSALLQRSKRAAVTFSIDASGRASAQTSFVNDASASRGIDSDAMSESSSTSSTVSMEDAVFSQPNSFAYAADRQKTRRVSSVPQGSSNHSQHSSYGSNITGGFGSSHGEGSRRPSLAMAPRTGPQVHFQESASFIQGPLNANDSEAETIMDTEEDDGNAQAELKKVLQRRSSQKSQHGQRSRFVSGSGRMSRGAIGNVFFDGSPISATGSSLATPSSGPSSVTRCVCSRTDGEGQLMVQWYVCVIVTLVCKWCICLQFHSESCQKWLHTRCVGLNERNVPNVYLCVFCTGPTPNARGGRIREPMRAPFVPASSPLAYKSHQEH